MAGGREVVKDLCCRLTATDLENPKRHDPLAALKRHCHQLIADKSTENQIF